MKYKHNFKNFRLSSALSNWANHVITLHKVKKEWRIAIVSLGIAKIFTMVISLYAGYSFFNDYYLPIIKGIIKTAILSTVTLFILELLTAVFLEKTFKFLYRGRFIISVLSLVAVSSFYSLSFVSSTEGLAKKQSEKIDVSAELKNKANQRKVEQESKTALLISEIDQQIKQIETNFQGWSGGKRMYLTALQLKNIRELNEKKEKIREEHTFALLNINRGTAASLLENNRQTEKTASQYYQFMAIIMIAQFFVTGLLVFFLYLIRAQESKDEVINEDLKEIQSVIETNAMTAMYNGVVSMANRLSDLLNQQLGNSENPLQFAIQKQTQSSEVVHNTPNEVIGFINKKSAPKNLEATTHANQLHSLTSRQIAYLNKHRQLVKAIKNTIKPPLNIITNNQVSEIQSRAGNAKHKSYTLVRNVFEICRAVGIENIDFEGNLLYKT